MRFFKHFVAAALVAGCATLPLAAQGEEAEGTWSAAGKGGVVRTNWNQRVLRRSHTGSAVRHETVPSSGFVPQWSPTRLGRVTPTTHTSKTVVLAQPAVEQQEPQFPSPMEMQPETGPPAPLPADEAYDHPLQAEEMYDEPIQFEGEYFAEEACAGCGGCGQPSCSACGPCGPVCGSGCPPCGPFDDCGTCGGCCGLWQLLPYDFFDNMSIFAGVHGFKGPLDMGTNGNFGFHEGLNWGAALGGTWGIGYQVGVQAVHSNFSGSQVVNLQQNDRDQVFFTAGVFRRAVCGGLQWGVAFDLLHDAYLDEADLNQVRAEVALVRPCQREIGFWAALGSGLDTLRFGSAQNLQSVTVEPIDIYAIYYRRYFSAGGQGRIWAGLTDREDAVFGADLTVPIGTSWALENNFTYRLPEEGRGLGGQQEEVWSVAIQLVWYPRRQSRCEVNRSQFRPLLNVADNSTFLVGRK